MGGGVLLILSFFASTANAKSLPLVSSTSHIFSTNDLSDRLAADKDFQDYSIAIYKMVNEVQKTKSGKLFTNYFDKKTSEEEKNTLSSIIGFSSNEEFVLYLKKINSHKLLIVQKFPELLSIPNNQEVIETASKKVVKTVLKPNPHTTGDCWAFFSASLLACTQGCEFSQMGYEYCLSWCYSVVSAAALTCFELAD